MNANWERPTLDVAPVEIMDGDRGTNYPKTADFSDSGYCLFLNAGNVTSSGFKFDDCSFVTQEKDEALRKGKLERFDVVLTTRGTVGNVAYYGEAVPFDNIRINSGMVILRPSNEELDPLFLYQFVRSQDFAQQVASLQSGTAQPQLPIRDMKRIKIPLPPLPEQRAIASILGALDDKIDLNRRMNATLESLARAIFKSWFVDFDPVKINAGQMPASSQALATHDTKFLDLFPSTFQDSGIPNGWESTTLGDEVDFQTGNAFKSKSFSSEPPGTRLARGMNVKEGVFFWGNQTRYWPEVTEDIEHYLLRAGDVLIGMDGSKVGKNWVRVREVDLPCLLVQRVARLRPSGSVGENFLWILCGSETFRRYVDSVKTGTSIPHISGSQIKSLSFVRPPKGDDRIFHEFENIVSAFANQHDENAGESASLNSLRDTLLPKLLSGVLSVEGIAEVTNA